MNLADYDQYMARFKATYRISGYGLETTIHAPCPFCAGADNLVYSILSVEEAMRIGATCPECGRSWRALIERDASRLRFEIVQTGGPTQPGWLKPPMRVLPG